MPHGGELPPRAHIGDGEGGKPEGSEMIAWILALFSVPLLAGFAVYLCRGPRQRRRLTSEQIAEWRVLAEIEKHEDLR